jgi:hypothetical protein
MAQLHKENLDRPSARRRKRFYELLNGDEGITTKKTLSN